MVKLSNSHIIISDELAQSVLHNADWVNWVYYAANNKMMMAPGDDELFKQVHKTTAGMLKLRNAQGDRGISVRELLIDEEIPDSDRELQFKAEPALQVLSIFF